ncbi:hypothetical protein, partial [Nostoc sp. KVJ20]|uniref:hypothetical protein n=1 Tax=Nostoc sp. KVJ20 TaxID=457944 RepID=UPI001C4083C8
FCFMQQSPSDTQQPVKRQILFQSAMLLPPKRSCVLRNLSVIIASIGFRLVSFLPVLARLCQIR